jgi:1-deoxy-D-xylulose-5-phosphate synthase
MRFVKPLDADLVCRLASTHSCIVTLEENVIAGGAGSAVAECLSAHGIEAHVHHIGYPDQFIAHGSREVCLVMAGIDAAGVERQIQRIWADHCPSARPAAVTRVS